MIYPFRVLKKSLVYVPSAEVGPVGLKDSRISIDDDQNIDVRV